MRASEWAGLVTNASPYVIADKAPGAATVQENVTSAIPGQLTSRGGMQPVGHGAAPGTAIPGARDLHSYDFGGTRWLIVLDETGTLRAYSDPGVRTVQRTVTLPTLTASAATVTNDYTGRSNKDGSGGVT